MLFQLVRPMRRKGSRVPYFVQRIPADLKRCVGGLRLAIPLGGAVHHVTLRADANDIRFSLRTADPSEVKLRLAAVASYLEMVWRALREKKPVPLTHKQATALAGELYRAWVNAEDRERTIAVEQVPGGGWRRVDGAHVDPEQWDAVLAHWEKVGATGDVGKAGEPSELEKPLGPLVDRLLQAKGIGQVDEATRALILPAFWLALRDAFERRKRNAEGDYSPDPKSERFPEWTPPQSRSPAAAAPKVSLTGLVEAWWTEAKAAGRKPSTHESYRNTMAAFVAFLGHDDASRVTPEDVIGFKDHRLASVNPRTRRPVSAKTVKDSDLSALKAIFGWAKDNRKIAGNPAQGVTIRLGRRRRVRGSGFTDAEANAILQAALHVERGRERPEMFAAKRWVPWLMAYTGARVGEMAQLRKEDVRHEGGQWVIRITPEAGTVKTDDARDVVLHQHLIDLGFVAFVGAARDGHLFLRPSRNGDVLGPLQGVKNRLTEFARTVVTDRNVAPNHGWRHRFKTVGLEAGVEQRILDHIQGQRPRTVGESYGGVTIRAQALALAKLPRYVVS